MKKTIIIWTLGLILLCSVASADLTEDLQSYFKTDNATHDGATNIDNEGNYNITEYNTIPSASGILIDSVECDGSSDYADIDDAAIDTTDFSMLIWVNGLTDDGNENIIVGDGVGTGQDGCQLNYQASANLLYVLCSDAGTGGWQCNANSGDFFTNLTSAGFHLIAWGHNGTACWVSVDSQTIVSAADSGSSDGGDIDFCRRADGNMYADPRIDEIAIYNRSLSWAEINEVWNNGSGLSRDSWGTPPETEVGILPNPAYWDDTLKCNVSDVNVTALWYVDDVYIWNSSFLDNFYFNISQNITCEYNNTNSSNRTIQPPTVDYLNLINNSSIYPQEVLCNYSIIHEGITTNRFYVGDSVEQVNNTTFYTDSDSYLGEELLCELDLTVSGQEWQGYQNTSSLTVGQLINFTATSLLNGSNISNFSITYDAGTFTADGTFLEVYNYNETDEYTFSHESYANTSVNLTTNITNQTYTFYPFTINSINFTFYDEIGGKLVTSPTIIFELISETYGDNYTTTTGYKYLDLLIPENYTIRYSAAGFYERFYYFTLVNQTTNNLNLYLINNTNGTNISATLYDEANRLVEGGIIKVLRYNISANAYHIVEMAKTNFEGNAILNLDMYDEFYKFIIEYPLGTVKKITNPTYIYATELSFQILLGTDTAQNFHNSMGISYSLGYNNATNNFQFTYSDGNNVVETGCMDIYRVSATGQTLVNSSCTSGAASSILLSVDNSTGLTYRASGYVELSNTNYSLVSRIESFTTSLTVGTLGLYVVWLLTIVFACIGIWKPSVACILTPIPQLIGRAVELHHLHWGIVLSLQALGIVIAYLISDRG